MELTHDEVQRIVQILESADFEYFEMTIGESSLVVGRTAVPRRPAPGEERSAASMAVADPPAASLPASSVPSPAPAPSAPTPEDSAIPAPMVGIFYSAPEPGAPPFVTTGSAVVQGQTIGLIEVMKMFNAVEAPHDGIISECLVPSESFVEYGQSLFLVRSSS